MIRIYGHSDDCVEIEGHVEDEIGAYDRSRRITIRDEDPKAGGEAVKLLERERERAEAAEKRVEQLEQRLEEAKSGS